MKYLLAVVVALGLASPSWAAQLNVVVVFDGSGSMGDRFTKNPERISKMEAAKRALVQMVDALPPGTNLGITCFSGSINGWLIDLGPLDKESAKAKILGVKQGGGTPLGQYMKEGANALLQLRAKQKGAGTYKLVIITDGESNDDIETPLAGKYGILSKGLKAEAIGVDMHSKHTLATKIPYRSAESADQLNAAVKEVVAESTGSNDHSEDYDLIAPIPPEVAMAAITALAEYDNAPIGQKPTNLTEEPTVVSSGGGGWKTFLWIFFSAIAIIAVVVAVYVIKGS